MALEYFRQFCLVKILKAPKSEHFTIASPQSSECSGQRSPSLSSLWMTVGPWLLQSAAFGLPDAVKRLVSVEQPHSEGQIPLDYGHILTNRTSEFAILACRLWSYWGRPPPPPPSIQQLTLASAAESCRAKRKRTEFIGAWPSGFTYLSKSLYI